MSEKEKLYKGIEGFYDIMKKIYETVSNLVKNIKNIATTYAVVSKNEYDAVVNFINSQHNFLKKSAFNHSEEAQEFEKKFFKVVDKLDQRNKNYNKLVTMNYCQWKTFKIGRSELAKKKLVDILYT